MLTSPETNGQVEGDGIPWVSLKRTKPRKVSWLLPGRVPLGALTLLEGRKGTGKSTIAAALAADATGGPRVLRGKRRALGSVLWLTVEEDFGMAVRGRVAAAGADLDRVHYPGVDGAPGQCRRLALPGDLGTLGDAIERHGVKLVVLDPYSSFIAPGVSLNDEQAIRPVLEDLAGLAGKAECAVLLIRHLRKSTLGPALDQGLGSTAIVNVARSVLRVDEYPGKPGCRILSHVACNLSEQAPSLAFELKAVKGVPKAEYQGVTDLDAEQLAEGQGDAGQRDEKLDAKQVLRNRIGEGWVPAKDVLTDARAAGVGETRLRLAKAELKVPSRHRKSGSVWLWEWGPPKGGWPRDL